MLNMKKGLLSKKCNRRIRTSKKLHKQKQKQDAKRSQTDPYQHKLHKTAHIKEYLNAMVAISKPEVVMGMFVQHMTFIQLRMKSDLKI